MKKQWISVKCGLSRDPKHRQTMGEGIWLFLHILDVATWDDGIVRDWKDEDAAEEMGMPIRTLREHRRKLDELGYITCVQKQYTQDVIIHNWTNPREYNGQVYNVKNQGGSETEPQGYTQGSTQDVTPTSYSKNQTGDDSEIQTNTAYNRGEQERPDSLALYLNMIEFPGAKREAKIDAILSYLGIIFKRNTSTKEWKEFAKYILSEKIEKGWDVEKFVKWLLSKPDYKADFWSVKRMMEFYPQAFLENEDIEPTRLL